MDIPFDNTDRDSNLSHIHVTSDSDGNNLSMYVFDFGPKRDPLSSVIPITVIYVVIFISGLLGNVFTCVVIIKNRHMRTATNYYLFSLALSDLLLLVVGLPPELYQLWCRYPYAFGEPFCILRGFASEMSSNASILTITCFTMERYLAICHPIRSHTMSKLPRVIKIIISVWILGALCAIPMAIQFGVIIKDFQGEPVPDTAECTVKYPLQNAFVGSTLCFFIIPMILISVLYIFIGMQLRESEIMADHDFEQQSTKLNRNRKSATVQKLHFSKVLNRQSTRSIRGTGISSRKAVIKMLFAVVVAFFLCWAPFHGQRLMAIYVQNPTQMAIIVYTVLTYISGVTYYVSATINPILYSIMSRKFRQAFKNTFIPCCNKRNYFNGSSRYSSYVTYRQSAQMSINNNSWNKRG